MKRNYSPTPNKYHARKMILDGITFDSKREAMRYADLKMLLLAGEISDLDCHPTFVLQPAFRYNGRNYQPIRYSPDFTYTHNGQKCVEDVKCKSTRTEAYSIRKRLFLAQHPDYNFMELE